MTERLREQLSALADDELEHSEVELLLYRYARDRELRTCWNSYHLIGEAIRRGHADQDAARISRRVAAELDATEGEGARRNPPRPSRWARTLKSAGAIAVAASVGVVAIVLVRAPAPVDSGSVAPANVVPRQASAKRVGFDYDAIKSVRWDQGSAKVRDQLNEYLFDHNANARSASDRSMFPYVHMAEVIDARAPVSPQASRRWRDDDR